MHHASTMKSRSLVTQVLFVNVFLIAAAVLLAAFAVSPHLDRAFRGREAFVLGTALLATMLGNWLVLRRRFRPLKELISAMESIDLATPEQRPQVTSRKDSSEVQRLGLAFERMVDRLESQRREAGRAAIQAQERERRRIAQDLHDEVNQALTAVSLRLQASIERSTPELRRELTETKRLATQAMEELLALARQLRPAVLDDHGLLPALHSQVRDFSEQTNILASFNTRGTMPKLTPEQQLVIYRVTQEGLSNVAQHAAARKVDVELSFIGRTVLRICDDGRGFTHVNGNGSGRNGGGLGLVGMRERALLIGGHLSMWSASGEGTRVELTINQ
jgi:two-component system sensor histidine kinase UhpB